MEMQAADMYFHNFFIMAKNMSENGYKIKWSGEKDEFGKRELFV